MTNKNILKSKIILSSKECEIIKEYILSNEDRIKQLGPDMYSGTSENSLTGRYKYFNYLYTDEIGSILIPKLDKIFSEIGVKYPISVQCWANTFRKNEGISVHKHGPINESFLCANLFISGPTKPGTTYYIDNNFLDCENHPGEIHIFDSNLYHYVSENKTEEIRISLAFDILPELDDQDTTRHYIFRKKDKKVKGFI